MMSKTAPIPYLTTLAELYDQINDSLNYFVTFRVQTSNSVISNATIPFTRFRPLEGDNHDLIEVRSCDCNGAICKHPTQRLHLSKSELGNYVFIELNNLHYVFMYMIEKTEEQ